MEKLEWLDNVDWGPIDDEDRDEDEFKEISCTAYCCQIHDLAQACCGKALTNKEKFYIRKRWS